MSAHTTRRPDSVVPGADYESLRATVIDWYAEVQRPLPWREPGTSAWGVLVSEVMSQQTPVSRVAPQWTAWMARWPTPADLAQANTADVLRAWGSLGYPRRALRLQAAAAAICADHGGTVPADVEALRALPGIGEYTAAAVAAFAFGLRHPVVDVNVRRVLARAVGGSAEPAPSLTAHEQRLAVLLLPAPAQQAALWSVAVMELGALVCTARGTSVRAVPDPGRVRLAACRTARRHRDATTPAAVRGHRPAGPRTPAGGAAHSERARDRRGVDGGVAG